MFSIASTSAPPGSSAPTTSSSSASGPSPYTDEYSRTPHSSARSNGPFRPISSAPPSTIRTFGRSRQRSRAASARVGVPSTPTTPAPSSPIALVSTPEPQPKSSTLVPSTSSIGASSAVRWGEKW